MADIIFRRKDDNLYEYIGANKGLVVIYGTTYAEFLLKTISFHVDYFIDRRASEIGSINGISVLDAKGLEEIVDGNDVGRVTIVIGAGVVMHGTATAQATVRSIYEDIIKLNIEADVFEFFVNDYVFKHKSFVFKDKRFDLWQHPYNCGYTYERMTERAVELALAKEWIDRQEGAVIEIGAVTPYYFANSKIVEIVDPMDQHVRVSAHKSMFEYNIKGKTILSISTLEHIGLGDYGFTETHTSVEAIVKVLEESANCFITVPYGLNDVLDEWLVNNLDNSLVRMLTRGMNNDWKETKKPEELNEMLCGVNCLAVIEK